MLKLSFISINEVIKCPTCKNEYQIQVENCKNCGYPFSADEKTKSKFVADQILKRGKINDTKNRLKTSRNILFAIAAVNLIIPLIPLLKGNSLNLFSISNMIIGLIFLFFGFLISKKPFLSVVIPLIFLVLLYTLQALTDFNSLLNGSIWKVFCLISLIYSIMSIIKSEKIRKESQFLSSKKY